MRHVNFHSYQTKLKSIGSNILARSKLPVCTLHNTGRNVVPDLSHAFQCCWNTCDQTFNSSQTYFNHVATHVNCKPHCRNMNGGIPCHWRGCKSVVYSVSKLADHVRRHTHEKLVGCPSCCGLFASRTKFSDHCKRQAPVELHGHQCPHCSKCYPSQKLLREHARGHMNHYKCPQCGKTCSSSSALRVHIWYRHLDSKPFKCSFCEHRSKTSYDMKRHLNTHCSSPLYHCEEKGCGLPFRTINGFRKHCDKCHLGNNQPLYCCHICDSLFQRTSKLTHHLHAEHGICRPSGHCRFRYKQDKDGFFRLLIVHPQGVQGTQTVEESKSGAIQPLCDSISTVSDDDTGVGGSRLLISAVELDSSGNTEASEKMETAE
ncbi:histone H4 transcription factor [Cryptotermes secundus]|nr:histone H4 transcription factor [Cryptotermes secundus]